MAHTVRTVRTVRHHAGARPRPPGARTSSGEIPEWSRTRLLAALGLLLVLALAVLAGAGMWLWFRLHPPAEHGLTGSVGTSTSLTAPSGPAVVASPEPGRTASAEAYRDEVAVAPMAAAPASAAQPSVLSSRDPGVIELPASSDTGPAGIPSGFPHTSAGAVAQLAAVDTDVLNTATLDRARQVIDQWAAPGGPTGSSWSAVKALAGFQSAAGLSGGAHPELAVRATPMMGLVKAIDGPDWAVVCIDFEVDATLKQTARVAVADCQRMVWDGGRWLLGPGPEPAPAPSIWPGTDAAIDAGYRNLRHG